MYNMGRKLRMYDLTCAVKMLTKKEVKENENLVDYFRRIDEAPCTHFPCAFADVPVIETRVACFATDPKSKYLSNLLVDIAGERQHNTPLLVMDVFRSGADALYLCMVTTDINKVFTKWVGLARPCRIHIFEIEDDPETITHLILAPLSCFIY